MFLERKVCDFTKIFFLYETPNICNQLDSFKEFDKNNNDVPDSIVVRGSKRGNPVIIYGIGLSQQ